MSFATPDSQVLLDRPLWFYIRKKFRPFSMGLFFLLITNSLDGIYPLILKKAVDQLWERAPQSAVIESALLLFLMLTGLAISRYFWRVFFANYHTYAADDLRQRLFNHLTTMGPSFFQKNPIGELVSLAVSDIQAFRASIGHSVLMLVDGLISICIILPMMIYLNPSWTWKTLIFLPLIPFLIRFISKAIFQSFKKQQDSQAELSGFAQETVMGIRVIKSFSQEENRMKQFSVINSELERNSVRTGTYDSFFGPVMEFGVASGSVILLFIGGPDVFHGFATVGTLVAFQRYISKMVWPVTALGFGLTQYQKGKASFERIKATLISKTDIPDEGHKVLTDVQSIQFKHLTFMYPGLEMPALSDVSFQIKSGEMVGIVGPVGSGKSTLAQLLSRLYPVEKNQILINGVSIDEYSQSSFRKNIILVPQEPFLFSESIAANMNFSRNESITDESLQRWARFVAIDQEINELPEKFNSQLGERGVNLSGGQKQRLTIVRGLMAQANVLILDDSLSAVDTHTERTIEEQLKSWRAGGGTVVIIAHRLSSVENADKIIVLNHGQVESIGSHQDLLKMSPTYQNLALLQGYKV